MKKKVMMSLDETTLAKLDTLSTNRSAMIDKIVAWYSPESPSGEIVLNKGNIERIRELKAFQSDQHLVNYAIVMMLSQLEQKQARGAPAMNPAMQRFLVDDINQDVGVDDYRQA